MAKWLFAAVLVLGAHFGASYLVPLDQKAQQTFGGLLKWFWPWADGDSGPLGVMTVSSGFPISPAPPIERQPNAQNRQCGQQKQAGAGIAGAVLSLFLMAMFFGATKIVPIALDLFVLWAAWTNLTVRA